VLVSDAASLGDAGALHAAGAQVLAYPNSQGLSGALATLGREGSVSALVEAGPGLFGALWDEDLIDELILVHAGGIGGASAPALYPWSVDGRDDELERHMHPVEAGIESEAAGTVWRRTSGPA
jgi:riboflavin biosynthesis pyrimidine reductase